MTNCGIKYLFNILIIALIIKYTKNAKKSIRGESSLENFKPQFHYEDRKEILDLVYDHFLVDYDENAIKPTTVSNIKKYQEDAGFMEEAKALIDYSYPHKGSDLKNLFELIKSHSSGLDMSNARTYAMVPSGNIDLGIIGDHISQVMNKFSGVYLGSTLNQLEMNVINWMCKLFNFSENCFGSFTSGASLANLHGALIGRDQKLTRKGIYDYSKVRAYACDTTHYTISKTLRLAGIPDNSIRIVPSTDEYVMNTTALEEMIKEDKAKGYVPFMVIATTGTTNVGAIDPIDKIAKISKNHNLHFHIDAAIGGFYILTEKGKQFLSGINQADTISMDLHKTMFFGHGIGLYLAKEKNQIFQTFGVANKGTQEKSNSNAKISTSYLPNKGNTKDKEFEIISNMDTSIELTRPNRGFKVWFALKLLGFDKFGKELEAKQNLGSYLLEELKKNQLLQIHSYDPIKVIPIVLFRCRSDVNNPKKTMELMTKINEKGRCFVSYGDVGGYDNVRMMVLNPKTQKEHIIDCIEDINKSSKEVCVY